MRIIIEVDREPDGRPGPGDSVGRTTPTSTALTAVVPGAPPLVVDDGDTSPASPAAWARTGALDAGAAATLGPAADPHVPAELLARAAALNALSAGRAPDLSVPAAGGRSGPARAPAATVTPSTTGDPPAAWGCGLGSGEFDGITNAGGPPAGLCADTP